MNLDKILKIQENTEKRLDKIETMLKKIIDMLRVR